MDLRRQIGFALILCIPSICYAGDARGWFQEDCSGAALHITKFAGNVAGEELVLRWSSGSPLPFQLLEGYGWVDVNGKLCSWDGKCQEASTAKVSLQNRTGSAKRISGKYAIDFAGQHLAGEFVVKFRRQKHVAICE
jgi:hypothetical protein